jgi:2-keto-4-pentenoate hydratase
VLLSDMQLTDGGDLRLADFVQPRVEAEIALILGDDLGAGATAADVLRATRAACPSIEVIDSRIANWQLSLVDTVADNASSGAFVLGPPVPIAGLDLAALEVVVSVNGTERMRGIGAAALGHPAAAAAWLANRLAGFGTELSAGSVVMTGSLHASFPVAAGDELVADFGTFGATRLVAR